MTDFRQPAYASLDPEARALVDRWAAELDGAPDGTIRMFRFLVAMVAVREGALREVARGEREGRPVVVLVSEEDEAVYYVEDPRLLPEAEREAVGGMAAVLVGS